MKHLVAVGAIVAGLWLSAPGTARAGSVSVAIGGPGFGFFFGAPAVPPVAYPAPVFYAPPCYRPAPVVVAPPYYPPYWGYPRGYSGRGWKRGHYRHARWW